MNLTIREFRTDDRDRVLAMADRLAIGVAPWRNVSAVHEAVLSWVVGSTEPDADGRAMVAEIDGEVVGFASLSSTGHFTGETDAYIGELIVDDRVEGRGVGAALVGAAEQAAIEAGHRCVTLTTGAANERALAFYDRLGYIAEDVKLTKILSGSSGE